jgi:catechol 2,3-dioxygenase-like lactoylglutathione lyase family enzyme
MPAAWRAECVDHVALPCSDLAASAAWYAAVLGFAPHLPHEPTFVGPQLAFLSQGGVALALLALPPGEAALRGSRAQKGHFAIRVDGPTFWALHAALPALLAAHRRSPAHSTEIFCDDFAINLSLFFYDPDGNEVEITTWDCERDPTCSRFGGVDARKSIRGGADRSAGADDGMGAAAPSWLPLSVAAAAAVCLAFRLATR